MTEPYALLLHLSLAYSASWQPLHAGWEFCSVALVASPSDGSHVTKQCGLLRSLCCAQALSQMQDNGEEEYDESEQVRGAGMLENGFLCNALEILGWEWAKLGWCLMCLGLASLLWQASSQRISPT